MMAKKPVGPVVRSAAIYARISADMEGKSLGVQRQLEDCRKLAADRCWSVGAEYVDNDVSAFSGKPRREYARMLAELSEPDYPDNEGDPRLSWHGQPTSRSKTLRTDLPLRVFLQWQPLQQKEIG